MVAIKQLRTLALSTTKPQESERFYTQVLGLGITDMIVGGFQAAFLGSTPRHHSVAIFGAHGIEPPVDHIMVEVESMGMVGRAHDRCLEGAGTITYTLGQHWNDAATSFYVQTPSGFDIEFGWGGRQIDRETWTPIVGDGEISYWGHHATTAELAQKLRADTYIPGLNLSPAG